MTAQIGDLVRYRGREHTVIFQKPHIPFHPMDYGIFPESACTACWRGFWCAYDVSKDGLFLTELYVNSADGHYPEIEGVVPEAREKDDYLTHFGHQLYKGVNLKIPYTGKLLIGDNFIHHFYIHMGFQRPWVYKKLVELVFENGKLTEANNHSRIAARVRRKEIAEGYEIPKLLKHLIKPRRKVNVWWYCDIDDTE